MGADLMVSGTFDLDAPSVPQMDLLLMARPPRQRPLPMRIPGLLAWFAADQGVTKDGSNNVSAWADLSGNGNNAVQATGASQPLWTPNVKAGRPAVHFDGVNDFLALPSLVLTGTQWTLFAVVQTDTPGTGTAQSILDADNGNAPRVFQFRVDAGQANLEAIGFTAAQASGTSTVAVTGTAWNILAAIRSNAAVQALTYQNTPPLSETAGGASGLSAGPSSPTKQITIGNYNNAVPGQWLKGYVGELAIYTNVVSTTNRLAWAAYANARWGVY